MFNPLLLEAPYDCLDFIQKQNPYDSHKGTDEMLDLMREIQESGNYYWQGISFPSSDSLSIAANLTVNGTVQIPPGSYVVGMNFYTSGNSATRYAKVKLYDKGSKASIFYGDYAMMSTVMSSLGLYQALTNNTSNAPSDDGSNLDDPFGTNFLLSPFIITEPGILGWEIVNLHTTAAQTIQVMLSCAIPINNRSLGNVIVEKEN